MFNFIKTHIDFRLHRTTLLALLFTLLIFPCYIFLPEKYGYENSLLENLQMAILFLGLFFAFTSKVNKKFFITIGLVLIILMLREVNCGRTLFFPIPGQENMFYGWDQIKYGYLAHPLYGLYIASVAVYFLWNKCFITLWKIIKNVKFPIWDILFVILSMLAGIYIDHAVDSMVLEESVELVFYVAIVGIIWLYTRHKDFAIEE